jgi:hypothetical protein
MAKCLVGVGAHEHMASTRAQRELHTAMGSTSWSSGGPGKRALRASAVLVSMLVVLGVSSEAGASVAATSPTGGASGSVASISGTTMEVQSTSSQTSVSWSTSTAFSETDSEALSAVTVGDCLMVTGTAGKKSKTTIAARSITISKPSSTGSCTAASTSGGAGGSRFAGGGGFGGFGGAGAGGTRPSGSAPSGGFARGSGGSRGSFAGLANLAIANGKVTAVKGSKVTMSGTVLSSLFKPGTSKSSKSKSKKTSKPAKLKTEKLKITTGKTTTLSETQAITSTSLAVGDCVTAFGTASSTGAVTASTVRITSTGGKSCSSGFGGFGGGGGGGGFGG